MPPRCDSPLVWEVGSTDATQYGVFFASAGHAALIDYPYATGLQALASKVYTNGGILSAVCHGPALFAGVVDEAGDHIAKGKTITGFTTEGEYEMHLMDILRSWEGVKMVDEWAEEIGAKCRLRSSRVTLKADVSV